MRLMSDIPGAGVVWVEVTDAEAEQLVASHVAHHCTHDPSCGLHPMESFGSAMKVLVEIRDEQKAD